MPPAVSIRVTYSGTFFRIMVRQVSPIQSIGLLRYAFASRLLVCSLTVSRKAWQIVSLFQMLLSFTG